MLNETILKKKKNQNMTSHLDRGGVGRKDFKQKFHKPTSTKVVTIWGLLPRAFILESSYQGK